MAAPPVSADGGMMKSVKWLGALSAVVLICGCSQESSNTGGTDDQTTSDVQSQPDRGLAPAYRQTNTTSQAPLTTTNDTSTTQPDNTGRNERDRSELSPTSGDQGGSEQDREMTRRIRSALTDNDQLSSSAKNIKVITANGRVTLRGPVNSEQEREQIANLVKQMGVTTVDNQLEVKTSNQ